MPGVTRAREEGPTIAVGDTGKIALAYVGSTNAPAGKSPDGYGPEYIDEVTWNGYITTSVDALSKRPRFSPRASIVLPIRSNGANAESSGAAPRVISSTWLSVPTASRGLRWLMSVGHLRARNAEKRIKAWREWCWEAPSFGRHSSSM